MTRLSFPAAVVVALSPLGCGGEDSSDRERRRASTGTTAASEPATRPALCTRLRAHVTGRVTTEAATELSGLALSHSRAGVLWTHNDSGDRARVFAVAPNGRLLAGVTVAGVEHVDWEDIAMGPAPDGGDALYIGDIGDNDETRPAVVVYRAPEPRLLDSASSASVSAQRLTLRYPDSPHNAEALLVDPSSGALFIVTKEAGGFARVYAADHPSTNATTTMQRVGRVSLGAGEAVTAGDISANGRTIAIRTRDHAFVWSRRRDESIASAMRRRPCTASTDLFVEGKGEAFALTRSGRAFYTVTEGDEPALRRYAPG
jgi:hypothetical protein